MPKLYLPRLRTICDFIDQPSVKQQLTGRVNSCKKELQAYYELASISNMEKMELEVITSSLKRLLVSSDALFSEEAKLHIKNTISTHQYFLDLLTALPLNPSNPSGY